MPITKEEFIKRYTTSSGITMEQLTAFGWEVQPCDCGYISTEGWRFEGWKMVISRLPIPQWNFDKPAEIDEVST